MGESTAYPPIADYALIGDCHTAALIARDGSIDWFCPDQFDAPAVFCRMLDAQQGGFFKTAPTELVVIERGYVPERRMCCRRRSRPRTVGAAD